MKTAATVGQYDFMLQYTIPHYGRKWEGEDPADKMTPGFTAFFIAFTGACLLVFGGVLSLFLGVFGLLFFGIGVLLMLGSPFIWIGLRLKAR